MSFSFNGELIITSSDDATIKLWDTSSGHLCETLLGYTGMVSAVALSPDDASLASGSKDGTVSIWNVSLGKILQTLIGHTRRIQRLFFLSDGNLLLSFDATVREWNLLSGHLVSVYSLPFIAADLAYSPNHHMLIVSTVGFLCIWDTTTGAFRKFAPSEGILRSTTISPDGQQIAAYSFTREAFCYWNVSSGDLELVIQLPRSDLLHVKIRPDCKLFILVTASETSINDLFLLEEANLSKNVHSTPRIEIARLFSDGNCVVSVDRYGKVEVYETLSGTLMYTKDVQEDQFENVIPILGGTQAVATNRSMATEAWLLQPEKYQSLATLSVEYPVANLTFSSCGRLLAGVIRGMEIHVWDRNSWNVIEMIRIRKFPLMIRFHAALPIWY